MPLSLAKWLTSSSTKIVPVSPGQSSNPHAKSQTSKQACVEQFMSAATVPGLRVVEHRSGGNDERHDRQTYLARARGHALSHRHSLPLERLYGRGNWSAVLAKSRVNPRPSTMLCIALPALAAFTPYQQLKAARVQDPRSSALVSPLDGLAGGRSLVVVLPQALTWPSTHAGPTTHTSRLAPTHPACSPARSCCDSWASSTVPRCVSSSWPWPTTCRR